MAWSADLIAVRSWIVGAILEVWPEITVAVDAPERDIGLPVSRVVMRELEFHTDTVLLDRLEVLFEIRVRRAVGSGIVSDTLLSDAEGLREELLADLNPGGVAELPMVRRIWVEQSSPGDEEYEIRMEFSCVISAERRS